MGDAPDRQMTDMLNPKFEIGRASRDLDAGVRLDGGQPLVLNTTLVVSDAEHSTLASAT
jgi:hypothetical protein